MPSARKSSTHDFGVPTFLSFILKAIVLKKGGDFAVYMGFSGEMLAKFEFLHYMLQKKNLLERSKRTWNHRKSVTIVKR